jgi:uncharacterized protein YbjT (DUF2867 family)
LTDVVVTGATGYLGSRLIPRLIERGHRVRAVVRDGSRLDAPGCEVLVGDVLRRGSWSAAVRRGDTLVHLVGTPRPNPAKARQFREVDLASAEEAVAVAREASAAHFVYVSVAQPAPVMQAYQEARAAAERAIREAGLRATILRPWYILGPGHRWPAALLPFYAVAKRWPRTREAARRLDLVRLPQMLGALVDAVEHPPANGTRIVEVPEIKIRDS